MIRSLIMVQLMNSFSNSLRSIEPSPLIYTEEFIPNNGQTKSINTKLVLYPVTKNTIVSNISISCSISSQTQKGRLSGRKREREKTRHRMIYVPKDVNVPWFSSTVVHYSTASLILHHCVWTNFSGSALHSLQAHIALTY